MKLKINDQGLLFKSNTQIDQCMIERLEELKLYTPQQLRISQQEIYDDFIQAKTGEDIKTTISKDPFVDVTGFSLKAFTVDRFKKFPHSPIVMSATTDFAPIRYLKTTQVMPKSDYERYCKDFKLKNKEVSRSTFRLPSGALHLKNSSWKFYFAANDHVVTGKGKSTIHMIYGLVFLEEEPVQLLMKTPEFERLFALLYIILNEFSHDFTGHGSIDFVINQTPEAEIYQTLGGKDSDVCTKVLAELRQQYLMGSNMAKIFDELRQLNVHMQLIGACIKRNKNYLKEINENACTFFDLLKVATEKMPGSIGRLVYNYFGQVYIFCAARMLPANYMSAVIGPDQVALLRDFMDCNNLEGTLNILSSIGSGLPVLKQGFGRNVVSCSLDDIAYYMDHRTIFMNTYNAVMK